jgi:hypothetical protein
MHDRSPFPEYGMAGKARSRTRRENSATTAAGPVAKHETNNPTTASDNWRFNFKTGNILS